MAPLVVAPALFLMLFAPLLGHLLVLPIIAWASICLLYGVFLARKAHDNDLLTSGFAIMVMHLAWSLGFWNSIINHCMRIKK
jgi:succinoglycan biosynthesis protein ExoA